MFHKLPTLVWNLPNVVDATSMKTFTSISVANTLFEDTLRGLSGFLLISRPIFIRFGRIFDVLVLEFFEFEKLINMVVLRRVVVQSGSCSFPIPLRHVRNPRNRSNFRIAAWESSSFPVPPQFWGNVGLVPQKFLTTILYKFCRNRDKDRDIRIRMYWGKGSASRTVKVV